MKTSRTTLGIIATVIALSSIAVYANNNDSNGDAHHQSKNSISTEIQHLMTIDQSLNQAMLKPALKAYFKARAAGLDKQQILTLIDYSKPSYEKRMWVIDMKNDKILYKVHVAHGKGSGTVKATKFSNVPQSKATSLGMYLTKDTYYGGNGLSLRMKGLDKGLNTNALKRYIVVHGAAYVSPEFIKKYGRTGRSWGCPAVSKKYARPIIHTIKGGTLLYAYAPNKKLINNPQMEV